MEQKMFCSINVFLHSATFEEYGVFVIKENSTPKELQEYLKHPVIIEEKIEDLPSNIEEKKPEVPPKIEENGAENKLGFSKQTITAY